MLDLEIESSVCTFVLNYQRFCSMANAADIIKGHCPVSQNLTCRIHGQLEQSSDLNIHLYSRLNRN